MENAGFAEKIMFFLIFLVHFHGLTIFFILYIILLVIELIMIRDFVPGRNSWTKEGMYMEVRKECDSDMTYHVGRMINGLSHQLKRQMCTLEEESGLTNMQSLVLHFIAFQTMERDLYQKDVEKAFQIRRSTATGILQFLEKEGYIYREAVERDARLKKIVPTEKTVELHGHIIANIHYMEDVLREGIPREDMETCMRVLEQMSANLAGNENDRGKETTKHE